MKKSLLLLLLAPYLQAQTVTLSSPDKKINVIVSDETQRPSYQVIFNGTEVISSSKLCFQFRQHPVLGCDVKISDFNISVSMH